MKSVHIYTDGSCLGNPGPGGWASIIRTSDNEQRISGGACETTNNRMELTGLIKGLEMLREPSEVTVYSDSQYLVNAFNKGWLKTWKQNGWARQGGELKNLDLWKQLDMLVSEHSCSFVWVKGHAGNLFNEECDKLAVAQSKKYAQNDRTDEMQAGVNEYETLKAECEMALNWLNKYLTSENEADMGVPCPCGALSYCAFCKGGDGENLCASALVAENLAKEHAEQPGNNPE